MLDDAGRSGDRRRGRSSSPTAPRAALRRRSPARRDARCRSASTRDRHRALRACRDGGLAVALDGTRGAHRSAAPHDGRALDAVPAASRERRQRDRSATPTARCSSPTARPPASVEHWAPRPDGPRRAAAGWSSSTRRAARRASSPAGLAYAFGACAAGGDDAGVSESWRHRRASRSAGRQARRAVLDAPAGLSRRGLSPAAGGGSG